jgi:T-complex protein 1 subunit eta
MTKCAIATTCFVSVRCVQVGDGTTSVVILAGELLREAKTFIEDGIHPRIIMVGYRKALSLALKRIDELAESVVDRKSE